ncbi:cell division protein CrgA [Spongisporangium articulatum]|uniref:Cell division protein CrgA n=1 Tax=Spongisporangium articulatum TaxID=3362603 RepID=A0ABW8ASE3_9ACTN
MPKHTAPTSTDVTLTAQSNFSAVPVDDGRKPSPPWVGGLVAAMIWVMALWLLGYTLLDLPFQQAIGPWNYLLLLGMVVVLAVVMRRWRGDVRRHVTDGAPAR